MIIRATTSYRLQLICCLLITIGIYTPSLSASSLSTRTAIGLIGLGPIHKCLNRNAQITCDCCECKNNLAGGNSCSLTKVCSAPHTESNLNTNSTSKILINRLLYTHYANDYATLGRGAVSNPSNAMPSLHLMRYHQPHAAANRRHYGSFGPGVYSYYDMELEIRIPTSGSGVRIYAAIPHLYGVSPNIRDRDYDGVAEYHNAPFNKDIRLYDAQGQLSTDHTVLKKAIWTNHDGSEFEFELMGISQSNDGKTYGRLTAIRDRNGNQTTITYQTPFPAYDPVISLANIAQYARKNTITDAYGRTATFTYGSEKIGAGYPVTRIDLPNGQHIDYLYNTSNSGHYGLVQIDHPDGTTSTFGSYDDPATQTLVHTFADAAAEGYHRNKEVYLSLSSWLNPNTGIVEPSAPNRVRLVTNGEGEVAFASLVKDIDGSNFYIYSYHGGNEMRRFIGHRNKSPQEFAYVTDFDWSTDPDTWPVTKQAASLGYDKSNRQNKRVDLLGRTQTWAMPSIIKADGQKTAPTNTLVTTNSPTETVHFDNTATTVTYNAFGQPLTRTDRIGRQEAWTYDTNGNRLSYTRAVGESEESTWTYSYDSRGLMTSATDANGNTTDYSYDSNGYLLQKTEPADNPGGDRAETIYTYTLAGLVESVTDPEGRMTQYIYDERNRLIATTYPDTSMETVTYGSGSDANLIVSSTDRNGITTTYSYDNAGRRTGRVEASGLAEAVTSSWTYLSGTTLESSYNQRGELTTYSYGYDNKRIATTVHPNTVTSLTSATEYDGLRRVAARSDHYGRNSYFVYDINDRLIRTVRETVTGALNPPALNTVSDGTDITARAQYLLNLNRDLSANAPYIITETSYDAEGQVLSTTDGGGDVMTYAYDQQGRRTQSIDAFGTSIAAKMEMDYDDQGNVIEIRSPRFFDATDADGFQQSKITREYTGRNLLKAETVAASSSIAATRSFSYFLDRRKKADVDFRGNTWSQLWQECCGRLQASIDPTSDGTIANTDFYGNITHTATASNMPANVAAYNWSDPADGNTVNETTTRYDGLHRPTHQTVWLQPLGTVVDHARATLGNGVIPIAGEDGVPSNQGLTTRMVYDDNLTDGIGLDATYSAYLAGLNLGAGSDGRAVEVTNPENEKTVTIYDGLGRVVKTIDGLGDANTVTYDNIVAVAGFGDVVEVAAADALNHITKQRSDGIGRRIESVDAENNVTRYAYNADSNLISYRDPNNVGQDCSFDARDRQTGCTDTQGDSTSHTYDANNNVVTMIDGLGNPTSCIFDARDRKQSCTDRISAATAYSYDANNNLISIIDAEGSITTYTYDVRNLLVNEVFPQGDAGTTQKAYSYDAARRLIDRIVNTLESPLTSETTLYAYDMANRLTTRGYPDEVNGDDTFTYDAASRLLTANSNRYGNTVTRAYDSDSKLISEQLSIDGTDYAISYAYDAADRQTGITYPNGKQVARSYTDRHQLEDVSYDGVLLSSSLYDPGMREITRNYGNGVNTTRTYRSDNLVSRIYAASGATDILDLSYSYDANKRKLSEVDALRSAASQTFNYDSEDRLTNWTTDNSATSQDFDLSLVGDWNSTVRTGADPINEIRNHTDVHEVTEINGNALTYDFKGNLATNAQNAQQYIWDAENRMKSIGNSVDAVYRYDALGRRVQKAVTDNSVTTTTTFISAGAQVVTEYANGVETQSYIYAAYVDEPVAMVKATGDTYYYHQNHLYSVEVITDSAGAIIETYEYDSHGKVTVRDLAGVVQTTSALDNPYYFTGRRLDAESGLYYFRARYFDSELGRFIGRDPLGYVDGLSMYRGYFVGNKLDPLGTEEIDTYDGTLLHDTGWVISKLFLNKMAVDDWDTSSQSADCPKADDECYEVEWCQWYNNQANFGDEWKEVKRFTFKSGVNHSDDHHDLELSFWWRVTYEMSFEGVMKLEEKLFYDVKICKCKCDYIRFVDYRNCKKKRRVTVTGRYGVKREGLDWSTLAIDFLSAAAGQL